MVFATALAGPPRFWSRTHQALFVEPLVDASNGLIAAAGVSDDAVAQEAVDELQELRPFAEPLRQRRKRVFALCV